MEAQVGYGPALILPDLNVLGSDDSPKELSPSLAQRRASKKALPSLTLALPKRASTHSGRGGEAREHDGNLPAAFTSLYEAGEVLGSGTTAVVRLAHRKSDGRPIAVKCVNSGDEEIQQFTRDEYELVKTFKHPGIVRFEALFESSCKVLICMEYCSDGSLQSYVTRNGVFDESVVRSLGYQLLRGADHLHKKRVVHRDIKPDNLLLANRASTLKITDFNSAKRIGSGDGTSVMLTDRGTPQYSAPELRLGLLWNERVDVWSSGLCLYFMLRAKLPFNIQDQEVKESLRQGVLPKVDLAEVTSCLQSLIMRALTVNMQDRPTASVLLLHEVFVAWYKSESDQPVRVASAFASLEISPSKQMHEVQPRLASYSEPFALQRRCGLVAIPSGRTEPVLDSPGSKLSMESDTPTGLSCYLLGPTNSSLSSPAFDSDENISPSPRKMMNRLEAQKNVSYANFKERRMFDALLELADRQEHRTLKS